ncbi:acetate uptake transporter [Peribacillus loiseleuriae]|uniref:acetate uptake transporter n=1 Tax=Peribacillus loiseleuriae TaxID=1679170 RepID=UPI0037F8D513
MEIQSHKQIKLTSADPSALGLFGLAIIALVESTEELGLTHGLSFMVPWVFFLGGLAQLFAAYLDAKNDSIFGTTVWGAFGLFWISLGVTWLIQIGAFGQNLVANEDFKQLGVAFVGYLIFSIFVTIAALETNKVLFFILLLLDIEFLGLSLSSFNILYDATYEMAAVSELFCALLSFYGSGAILINTCFGKTVLPLGKPFGIFVKH